MQYLSNLPVEVRPDRTLRVKITDACGLACSFCHNEGTPVTADNMHRPADQFTGSSGRSGRVSIYLRTNGADFLPSRIAADADFALALAAVRGALPTSEVHLTVGEPTLHPDLPGLITIARRPGLTVGLTSNGEAGAAVLPAAAAAGLDRINLSVFGTTPEELAAVQGPRRASPKLAERKLAALDATIEAATAHGVKVSANIVIPDRSHVDRVLRHEPRRVRHERAVPRGGRVPRRRDRTSYKTARHDNTGRAGMPLSPAHGQRPKPPGRAGPVSGSVPGRAVRGGGSCPRWRAVSRR
ncbi:radical SAM protein [Streptomyces gelaticus]